jgi:TonB family C-terminal domain
LVKEEAPPSVEDLKDKNIGKVTREGVDGGGDIRSDANVDFSNELEEKKPEVVKEDVNKQKVEDNKVFTFAEEMPSFPGGDGALYAFLSSNIQYPEIAKRAGVEGQVIVSFTVSKTGQISSPRIARGIGGGCDEEALRVVMMMPRWNPGKQNGQPVNVQVTVPIRFQLQ